MLLNGEYVTIEQIQHEILESPILVYNFEVEDFHTYHVGNSGVLVHNTCGPRFTPDQQAVIDLAREKKNGVSLHEAELLVGWANEYGISYHGPMKHENRSGIWSILEHIKIFNLHIPTIGDYYDNR